MLEKFGKMVDAMRDGKREAKIQASNRIGRENANLAHELLPEFKRSWRALEDAAEKAVLDESTPDELTAAEIARNDGASLEYHPIVLNHARLALKMSQADQRIPPLKTHLVVYGKEYACTCGTASDIPVCSWCGLWSGDFKIIVTPVTQK